MVQRFMEAWNQRDFAEIMTHLSDDIVYQNLPRHLMRGHGEAGAFIKAIIEETSKIELRLDAIAASDDGRVALTERWDFLHYPGWLVILPIMGIFEIRDGLITAWRDYTDGATAAAQFAQVGVRLVLPDGGGN